jgi:hypothetical protein
MSKPSLETVATDRRGFMDGAAATLFAAPVHAQASAGIRQGAYRRTFTDPHEHRTISGGTGHILPRKASRAFPQAVPELRGSYEA